MCCVIKYIMIMDEFEMKLKRVTLGLTAFLMISSVGVYGGSLDWYYQYN